MERRWTGFMFVASLCSDCLFNAKVSIEINQGHQSFLPLEAAPPLARAVVEDVRGPSQH